jgi:predicted metallo-beta-lactamase superfamily hydrolase
MEMIAKEVETLVIDHHLLRDEGWYRFLEPVRKSAEKMRHRVITAAELVEKKPNPLECRRKELYEEEKPSAEFLKWSKLPKEKLSETAPPL